MISRLRQWWQIRTGEYETPFDDDVPAWTWSMVVHAGLLIAIAWATLPSHERPATLTLAFPEMESFPPSEPEVFEIAHDAVPTVGADSVAGADAALSQAPILGDIARVNVSEFRYDHPLPIELREPPSVDSALTLNSDLIVKGSTGVGVSGAAGAVDRLTQEILLSLEERATLVVWLFDQSASLIRQREEIQSRFSTIYEELGATVGRHRNRSSAEPLLSSIIAFGKDVELLTEKPTADPKVLQEKLEAIERDDSGVENVFQAVVTAAERYRRLRTQGERNVMIIIFTDEAGDDHDRYLEKSVAVCRKSEIPVYVVGVPAPFGRRKAEVKWIDPDPRYDQSPQRGLVDQGPESFLQECIQLKFPGMGNVDPVIDSGFGPFGLTRLCYESGGIYFSVHSSRRIGEDIAPWRTDAYTSFLQRFFDEDRMRRYRPDYVSREEYLRQVAISKLRTSLVKAASADWGGGIETPRTRFIRRDETGLVRQLTEAQKAAAVLEPRLNALTLLLSEGESDRATESVPRWQAGYDLALGRALAAKIRTESYNLLLSQAKQGKQFTDPQKNTWVLRPSHDLNLGSRLNKQAEKAKRYLHQVVHEHPQTPWAYLAQLELDQPIGWRWIESFTNLQPRPERNNNNNNNLPADDQRRMLPPPKPKRPLPNL